MPLKRVEPHPASAYASCVIIDDDAAPPYFPDAVGAPTSIYPEANRLGDRAINSGVPVNSSGWFAAFIQDVFVRSSVKGHHGDGSNRIALLVVERPRDRCDRGDGVGQFAGQPVTHHPAVGEARDEDPSAVNVQLFLHLRD